MRHLSADLPGTGGAIKVAPEDFFVEELPAYAPSGEGEHIFATVEKQGLTTYDVVRLLAQALGVREGDIGTAGLKDRHAITRQQLSLPRPVTPEQVLALELPGVRILSAARHGNKLKTGHLRGNRFVLVVRGPAVPVDEAVRRAQAILERVCRPPGLPNWYGEQRFGRDRDNAARGRALVRGERVPVRDPRQKRLLLSAWQSELFNRYLEARLADGLYDRVIPGDVLKKTDTGGLFETADPATDQPRLHAGAIAPTGPMFGVEMRAPTAGTDAALREATLLEAEGLTLEHLARIARLLPGTRRPLGVPVGEAQARPSTAVPDAFELEFTLPSGAYATVVAGEVLKSETLLDSPPDDAPDPNPDTQD